MYSSISSPKPTPAAPSARPFFNFAPSALIGVLFLPRTRGRQKHPQYLRVTGHNNGSSLVHRTPRAGTEVASRRRDVAFEVLFKFGASRRRFSSSFQVLGTHAAVFHKNCTKIHRKTSKTTTTTAPPLPLTMLGMRWYGPQWSE